MADVTLVEFLTGRLDEDEATARAARDEAPDLTWEAHKVYDGIYAVDLGPATHANEDSYGIGADSRMPREMAEHITRHDPARVLREVEAKRAIVAEVAPQVDDVYAEWTHVILRHLAAVYSDHTDYDEAWRP